MAAVCSCLTGWQNESINDPVKAQMSGAIGWRLAHLGSMVLSLLSRGDVLQSVLDSAVIVFGLCIVGKEGPDRALIGMVATIVGIR
jgi:hypothetical protein